MTRLEVDHIMPLAKGGNNAEANLWLACPICNRYNGDKISDVDPDTGDTVPIFNPCTQVWSDHFRRSDDGLRIVWTDRYWPRHRGSISPQR
jgi:HNH endonuclease